MQNDPYKCKIKLEKFHFGILCCYGVIKESLPEGEILPPPPHSGEIGLKKNSISIYDKLLKVRKISWKQDFLKFVSLNWEIPHFSVKMRPHFRIFFHCS